MNTFVITYQPLDKNKMIYIQFYWLRNINLIKPSAQSFVFQKLKLFHYSDNNLKYRRSNIKCPHWYFAVRNVTFLDWVGKS